jgi:hypothetical protein
VCTLPLQLKKEGGATMTNEEQRIIGQLQNAVEGLAKQAEINREENRADFNRVFAALNTLQSTGCALGARNARDIEHLTNAPARAISIGAALVAVLSGIASALALWRNG